MTPHQIADRAAVLDGIDAAMCGGCGASVPDGAASDLRWFVDVAWSLHPTLTNAPTPYAIIRCPACW